METEKLLIALLDRTARIEENQNFMLKNIDSLPQSPVCAADFEEVNEKLDTLMAFKNETQVRVAKVGGFFLSISLVLPYILDWVWSHIRIEAH